MKARMLFRASNRYVAPYGSLTSCVATTWECCADRGQVIRLFEDGAD